MNHSVRISLSLFCFAAALAAQDAKAAVRSLQDPWLAPLHGAAPDPRVGAYGIWASGPDFKASFHDGPTFYPLLGTARPDNLPLRLATRAIRCGETGLLVPGATPRHAHTAWRYAYDYGVCSEAYDVSARGIEQTFTFGSRPSGGGDLEIEVAVTSELRAAPRAAAHAELVFHASDGEALVRYGAAFVVDAAGARTPLTTSFDGSTITLRVPAALVASASYPLIVDPLLSRVLLSVEPTSTAVAYAKIGAEPTAAGQGLMLAYTRFFTGRDADCYAQTMEHDFTQHNLVLADVSANFASRSGGIAFAGGPKKWAVALEREYYAPTRSWCDVYFHDLGSTVLNGGWNWSNPSTGNGNTLRRPSIGGSVADEFVFLAYCADATTNQADTTRTRVAGWVLDVANRTGFTTEVDLNAGDDDCDAVHVSPRRDLWDTSWNVAYQRRDNAVATNRWEIWCSQVQRLSGTSRSVRLAATPSPAMDLIHPKVAGCRGEHLLTFVTTTDAASGGGTKVDALRYFWDTASAPLLQQRRELHRVTAAGDVVINSDLAIDPDTCSHWVALLQVGGFPSWDALGFRLGGAGGVLEAHTVYAHSTYGAFIPSVTASNGAFKIAHTTNESPGFPIYGRALVYPPDAATSPYGTSCGGALSSGLPYAGHARFEVVVTGAPSYRPAALLLGTAPADVPLDVAGMPGCTLLIANLVTTLPFQTNSAGAGWVAVPIPEDFVADLFWQAAISDPSVPWTTKARTTRALRTQIRR